MSDGGFDGKCSRPIIPLKDPIQALERQGLVVEDLVMAVGEESSDRRSGSDHTGGRSELFRELRDHAVDQCGAPVEGAAAHAFRRILSDRPLRRRQADAGQL